MSEVLMSRWLVKELADITGTSVQTLHHYDRIGLLKPSGHSAKGYRIYNEADLLRLQQIIALKFFGFELKQIKTLLNGSISIKEHFLAQASFLESKAKALLETSAALKKIIADVSVSSSLPWQSIINLIEVYRMSENLENTWVKEILTPEELKQYVQFEEGLKERFNEAEKNKFHREWAELISLMASKLKDDPATKSSMELAAKTMKLINHLYGEEHANLRQIIWEKGFKQGYAPKHSMTQEMVTWLDKAIYAYYSQRIYALLKTLDFVAIEKQWQSLMKEMFSDNEKLEVDAVHKLLKNEDVSSEAKHWLKTRYNK
jgi:DNA-binding transcriptional MerR regulator